MDIKTITIIALIVLSGCNSRNDDTTSSPNYTPQTDDSPAVRFRQECLNNGYDEQSKAFFNCIESHWAIWRQSINTNVSSDKETDSKKLAKAIKQCDQRLAAKKLKSNYERGKCMNSAFEKYASIYPPIDKAAFDTFRTNILLIMVRLDKKEISNDEAQVLLRQGADKLAQAENTVIAEAQSQKTIALQQAYQNQVQQQQYESARSAAMTQGMLGILQNHMQEQRQRQAYIPPPQDIKTECSTYYGKTTCYTNR